MRTLVSIPALLLATLAGCAQFQPELNYHPRTETVVFPALGQAREAAVGEDVLTQTNITVRDAIYVRDRLAVSGYFVMAGYFRKAGETDQGEFFVPAGGNDGGSIFPRQAVEPALGLVVRRTGGSLCVLTKYQLLGCDRPDDQVTFPSAAGIERRQLKETSSDAHRDILVYRGKEGNRITLLHREVSQHQAPIERALDHDLGTSRLLDHRGVRIEVLDATARSIRYRIIESRPTP